MATRTSHSSRSRSRVSPESIWTVWQELLTIIDDRCCRALGDFWKGRDYPPMLQVAWNFKPSGWRRAQKLPIIYISFLWGSVGVKTGESPPEKSGNCGRLHVSMRLRMTLVTQTGTDQLTFIESSLLSPDISLNTYQNIMTMFNQLESVWMTSTYQVHGTSLITHLGTSLGTELGRSVDLMQNGCGNAVVNGNANAQVNGLNGATRSKRRRRKRTSPSSHTSGSCNQEFQLELSDV